MKIYMVRHGQTDSNVAKRIMGQRIDEPLNEEGKRQARELVERIKNFRFDVIFSSPLKRAHETAQIIAKRKNIPVMTRNELQERDFGSLSGKTWPEAATEAGISVEELRSRDRALEYDYRPYSGESANDFRERFLTFIEGLKKDYADKRVLIVAHAGVLRLAHALFREVNVDHIENASLEEFEV